MFNNNKKCKVKKEKFNGSIIWKVITPTSPCYDRIFSDKWDALMYAKKVDKLHK